MRLSLNNCDDELALKLSTSLQCASESEILLPEKCNDISMPCHRFLDLPPFVFVGGRPIHKTKNNNLINNFQIVDNGFVGCIRNIMYNTELIHFSSFDILEKVGNGIEPGCRKYRPDLCTYSSPCTSLGLNSLEVNISNNQHQVKCVDKWLGHICRCVQRIHSDHGCQLLGLFKITFFYSNYFYLIVDVYNQHFALSPPFAITFFDDSYVKWRLMDSFSYPFTLYFEFRTRERQTQLIVMEFETKSQFLLISVFFFDLYF